MPFPRPPAATALLALALLPAAHSATLAVSRPPPAAVCRGPVAQSAGGVASTPLLAPLPPGPPPERRQAVSAAHAVPPFAMFLVELFARADGPVLPSGAPPR